jgi:small conductance mechanosensitive channel
MELLSNFARELGNQLLQIGIVLGRSIVTLGIAWLISRVARNQLEPRIARQRYGKDGALLIGRLISITAYVIAIVSVMNQMLVDWTGILTLLSAFTVAIGLSLQDVIRNFFSGILLLLERPFSVGDRVRVRDFEGEIQGIDIRTTLIRNLDGALIHIPNSIMFSDALINRSHFRTRRFRLTISDSERSVNEIEGIVQAELSALGDIRKPIRTPEIRSISPDGVVVAYSLLVNSNHTINREVMLALGSSLPGAVIEVIE